MVNQKTGTIEVLRKGLSFSDLFEEGGVEGFEKSRFFDIIRGKMAAHTGFNIPSCIDVKVFSPSCDTTPGQTTIIPEVDKKHGFGRPKIRKALPDLLSLLWSGHQTEIRILSNGNVMKIPEEDASLLNQKVDESLAAQYLCIFRGLSGRDSEEETGPP